MKALHFKTNETSAIGVHSAVEVYEIKMLPEPRNNKLIYCLNTITPNYFFRISPLSLLIQAEEFFKRNNGMYPNNLLPSLCVKLQ